MSGEFSPAREADASIDGHHNSTTENSRIPAGRKLTLLFLLMNAAAATLSAQRPESPKEDVRSLNTQVLQAHGQFASTVGALRSNAVAARGQMDALLQRRAGLMRTLIEADPAQALGLAFSPDLVSDLAAAYPDSRSKLESHGSWQGPAEYYIADDLAGKTSKSFVRVTVGAEKLSVFFAGQEPPAIKCGSVLQLQGIRLESSLAATGTIVEAPQAVAGMTPPCSPLGTQNVAVLLVNFPGFPALAFTPQNVRDIFFSPDGRSVDGFWREGSYNQTSATGNVFGTYTLNQSYTCDRFSDMLTAAIAAADGDVDFRQYNRVFVVFPETAGCGWAGLSGLGCSTLNSPSHGPFTASASWLVNGYMTNRNYGVNLAAHEGGHGLGLHHSSSRDFGPEPLGPVGSPGTLDEYGDGLSSMGGWNLGHYATQHKAVLGWLAPETGYRTVQSSGTFSLPPLATPGGGLRGLKVQRGAGNDAWLWIENKKALGLYESTLPPEAFSGALIHYEDSTTGLHTHVIDFTPQTQYFYDAPLAAGSTWKDPYTDLSLSVSNGASGTLNVVVTYGSGSTACVNNVPAVVISPMNPSVNAGASVSYTLTVTNRNSTGCAPGVFFLSAALPVGWNASFSPASLNLAPGQSGSVTVSEAIPASASAGTYPISITADAGGYPATVDANTTVLAPPPPTCTSANPGVAMSPGNAAATPGASVSFTVTVRNNDGSGCPSGSFNLSSAAPAGWVSSLSPASLTLAPGQSGSVTLTKSVPAQSAAGTYQASVNVAGTTNYGSAAASITVAVSPPVNCTPATPAVALSPGTSTALIGGSVKYTLTVVNNDGAGCASAQFNLSSAFPTGWNSSFAPAAITLAPGQTGTATLTQVVPATTVPGAYVVLATAASTSSSGSASATCLTTAPPVSGVLSVQVSLAGNLYPRSAPIPITARVVSGTTAVPGGTVRFALVRPDGVTDVQTVTTDGAGQAVWRYQPSRSAKKGPGVYSVSATATLQSQSAASATVTFTVQ